MTNTTTTRSFTTVEDVYLACDEAKMMYRTQHGGLGEVSYWIDINHKDPNAPMSAFYSEKQLIGWANHFFNTDWDALESDEDEDAEDVFFQLAPLDLVPPHLKNAIIHACD